MIGTVVVIPFVRDSWSRRRRFDRIRPLFFVRFRLDKNAAIGEYVGHAVR